MEMEVKEGSLQQWRVKVLSFHRHLLLLRHDDFEVRVTCLERHW